MSEPRKTATGDLIMVAHAVAGIAALVAALLLGWLVNPALFVVNVSISMLSIMALAYNWMAPLPKGVSSDDFEGIRYRALLDMTQDGARKLIARMRWCAVGLFAAFAFATAAWWGGNDPYIEGTALALLICGVWSMFFIHDLNNHARYNLLDGNSISTNASAVYSTAV